MSEPARLFTVAEIAAMLGVRREWVHNRLNGKKKNVKPAPAPDFVARTAGKNPMMLWLESTLPKWLAYHASVESVLGNGPYTAYSDHAAVNIVRETPVTWKLWWRCTPDGGTMWWFSTPDGWWCSDNDGGEWYRTGYTERPPDYRYYSVNGSVTPASAIQAVLHSANRLRCRLENGSDK